MSEQKSTSQQAPRRTTGKYLDVTMNGVALRPFVPAPMPPDPPILMDGELHRLLNQAHEALARLNGSILTLPNAPLFVYMYVRKEAVLSSQIEGTQSSLDDLLAAEAEILSSSRPRDVDEVVNYVRAMDTGIALLERLPISVRLVRELHRELLTGVRGGDRAPGELRDHLVWIGDPRRSVDAASFVPPPPERVPDLLAAWERFVHERDDLPDLIRIGLTHVQFETIHPFGDGNGRVGRLLIALQLCEMRRLDQPVLYLSHYFKVNRPEYYRRLNGCRTDGDFEGWLRFFLRGVIVVSAEAAETARQIVLLREAHRTLVLREFGRMAGNGLRLLEALYDRPIVATRDVRTIADIGAATAKALVDRFCEHGLLEEVTGYDRNRRYLYRPYTDLFRVERPGIGLED